MVWRAWFARNSLLFDVQKPDFLCSLGWCKSFLSDFSSSSVTPASLVPMVFSWSPPFLGSFKINCRAVSDIVYKRTGLGILIRDHVGMVKSSCSLFLDSGLDFVSANAVAILKGIQFGKHCGLFPFCVESDAFTVVNLINLRNHSSSGCGNIVSDVLIMMNELGLVEISAGRKGSNKAALTLARQALSRGNDNIRA